MMGKTAGRWTKEEHKKFVQGKKKILDLHNIFFESFYLSSSIIFWIYSSEKLWQRLEARRGIRADTFGRLDKITCSEVLHQNLEKVKGKLRCIPQLK
jgi:hypothetical protein